jgi:ferredoxin
MPTITVSGQTITCDRGANLRRVLLKHDISLYNGGSQLINCRGIGSCGTCAVAIVGEVSEINWKEKARLSLPPHKPNNNRRLACQVQVFGDIEVTKYDGFWGQGESVISDQLSVVSDQL